MTAYERSFPLRLIIEREKNPERKSFYELCWHLGGSQSDVVHLTAEDIDWQNHTIAYARKPPRGDQRLAFNFNAVRATHERRFFFQGFLNSQRI